MGRVTKATVIGLLLMLLVGCNKPGDINPNLNHVDVITPGIIPGQDDDKPSIGIDDNWGIDPDDYSDLSEDEKTDKITQDRADAQREYFATYMQAQGTTAPIIEDEEPEQSTSKLPTPTATTFHSYSTTDLFEVYGNADVWGFYGPLYENACSRRGQVISKSNNTYDEEVVNYSALYGYRDTEFVYPDRVESYWFEGDTVYSVAQFNGNIVTTSEGPYVTDWDLLSDLGDNNFTVYEGAYTTSEVTGALYTTYGTPLQEDFHHIIWKTENGYVCYNRRTYYVCFTEE